jgi:hypothetical protein
MAIVEQRQRIGHIKVTKIADPEMLYGAIRLMNADPQAELLNMMPEEQRLLVVQKLSEDEEALALQHLDSWQEREMWNWIGRIMDAVVMTREQLPSHYPAGMKSCVRCGKVYEVWASVITADCQIHSFCELCTGPDGCCLQCDV